MKMKIQSIIGIFLIVTSGVAGAKLAAPFVVDAGSQSMTATVVDIDHAARTVTRGRVHEPADCRAAHRRVGVGRGGVPARAVGAVCEHRRQSARERHGQDFAP